MAPGGSSPCGILLPPVPGHDIPKEVENSEILKTKYDCKLSKALYRLRASPRRCYEKFKETMINLRFTVYPFEVCSFHWSNGKDFVTLAYM